MFDAAALSIPILCTILDLDCCVDPNHSMIRCDPRFAVMDSFREKLDFSKRDSRHDAVAVFVDCNAHVVDPLHHCLSVEPRVLTRGRCVSLVVFFFSLFFFLVLPFSEPPVSFPFVFVLRLPERNHK